MKMDFLGDCKVVILDMDGTLYQDEGFIARNVAYLAEQLCLSTNTIRSHSKTLYTKLGVHNKQELIDLVDAAEGPRFENAAASQAENLAAG